MLHRYSYVDAAKAQRPLEMIRRHPVLGYYVSRAFVGILSTQAWDYLFVERYAETFRDRPGTTAGAHRVSTGVTS